MASNKKVSLIFTQVCMILVLSIACVPPWQSEAALFLEDLAVGNEASRLKSRTPTPSFSSVSYQIMGDEYEADLYQPGEVPLAGIVLVPGVAEHGRNDPRLIALANTLARSRFIVLVPEISNLQNLKIRAEDSKVIMNAFTYLISRPEFPVDAQAGIGAFSYAVGPTLLASLKPSVRDRVKFILSVGGYYDVQQVITFFTTGYFIHNQNWQYLEPNAYGKWVFVISNIDRLSNTNDKEIFYKIAQRKINNSNASIEDLVPKLTNEADSILALLQNKEREHVPRLINNLPIAIRNDLNALDLSNKYLTQLKARLILLHGTDDNIIPFTESIALSNAVANDQANLFLIEGLAHVNVHPEKLNRRTMVRAINTLLNVRNFNIDKT